MYAASKAGLGKHKKANVRAFFDQLDSNIESLHLELKNSTYQPGGYRTFKIYDPKERMISAAPFRDRVVHHALCNIIEPIFDRTLIADTYANRKGKGTHAGIHRCQYFLRRYPYVLKADIKKYFPSIDHQILKAQIRRKIKCKKTLWLIDLIIDGSNSQEPVAEFFPGDDLFSMADRRRGLPMGNLTSQFFANVYLSPLDHYLKAFLQIKGYVRYVDDFVVFHEDKQVLHDIRNQIEQFLGEQLRLRLHPRKTVVFPTRTGVPFLGQHIFHTHRRLKRENLQRFRKRFKNRVSAYYEGLLTSATFEQQLNSWCGHARQAHTGRLLNRLFFEWVNVYGLPVYRRKKGSWAVLG